MYNVKRVIGMAVSLCLGLILTSGPLCPEASAAAKEAKIGFALSMTGGAAAYGATQKKGAELAVDQINAAAGAEGTQDRCHFRRRCQRSRNRESTSLINLSMPTKWR